MKHKKIIAPVILAALIVAGATVSFAAEKIKGNKTAGKLQKVENVPEFNFSRIEKLLKGKHDGK